MYFILIYYYLYFQVNGEKLKTITTPGVNNTVSSSDDTDSLFSTLNGDSVDGSITTTGLTNDKIKTTNNGRRAWSDLGGQNSEEENENNAGILFIYFVISEIICYLLNFNLYL